MNNKVTFKPYDMNQLKLPIDLAIDISENHLVKIVGRYFSWLLRNCYKSSSKKNLQKIWLETCLARCLRASFLLFPSEIFF